MQLRLAGAALGLALTTLVVPRSDLARAAEPAHTAVNTAAHTITIKDFMFSPVTIKIKPGTQVTWTNKDEEPHTVSSNEGTFRSFALDTNDAFSYKFDKPGTYRYTCTIHPRMTGTIVVE